MATHNKASEDNNKDTLLQSKIDILRDERKEINTAWRGDARLWWTIMSGLFIVALSVLAFILNQQSSASIDPKMKQIAFGFCFIIFVALMGVYVYFEISSMRYALRLILIDTAIKRIIGLKIITFADLHPLLGKQKIPSNRLVNIGLAALWIAWTIMASYLLYETISNVFGSRTLLYLFVSIVIVIIISLIALRIYQETKNQIKNLIDKETKDQKDS